MSCNTYLRNLIILTVFDTLVSIVTLVVAFIASADGCDSHNISPNVWLKIYAIVSLIFTAVFMFGVVERFLDYARWLMYIYHVWQAIWFLIGLAVLDKANCLADGHTHVVMLICIMLVIVTLIYPRHNLLHKFRVSDGLEQFATRQNNNTNTHTYV